MTVHLSVWNFIVFVCFSNGVFVLKKCLRGRRVVVWCCIMICDDLKVWYDCLMISIRLYNLLFNYVILFNISKNKSKKRTNYLLLLLFYNLFNVDIAFDVLTKSNVRIII